MSHRVTFAPAARRAMENDLPVSLLDAVLAFIRGALADNPHCVGKPMRPPLAGRYSARRGTYRIVYSIDDETQSIRILDIGHRADIYRP